MSLFTRSSNASGFVFSLSLQTVEFKKKNKQQKMVAKLLRFWKKKNVRRCVSSSLHSWSFSTFCILGIKCLFCGSWIILSDRKCPFNIFSVSLFLDSVINVPHFSSSWVSDWGISMVSGLLISTLLLLISIFLLTTRNSSLLQHHHEHCFPNLFFHSVPDFVVRDSKFLSLEK